MVLRVKADGGPLRVINCTTGVVVAERVEDARSFRQRLVGLAFRKTLPPGHGLLLRPCNAIHTCFMRFAIDAVYLASDGRVLRVDRHLEPWRIARPCFGAVAVLELPAGGGNSLDVGHVVRIEQATSTGERSFFGG